MAIPEARLRYWMAELTPRLVALSAGICRDRHRAEEVVQEAFVKLWSQPPDAGEIAYPSWLRRVVTNLSINALQRTKRPSALPEFSPDPAMRSVERSHERRELREELDLVQAAMERLDPPKRAILMLRANEQMSYDDIATHLGVPIGTVMSRLNRARTALMEELSQEAAEGSDDEEPVSFDFKRYRA